MIDHLIAELGEKLDLTAEELADVIWLTLIRQEGTLTDDAVHKLKSKASATVKPTGATAPVPPPTPNPRPRTQHSATIGSSTGSIGPRSSTTNTALNRLPIKVTNPPSLRNPLALARSLRPLMQKVPSGRVEGLDEQATAQQIAEAGIWQPIVKPELEPWLEITLVVDKSASMLIWKQTVLEFRKLLRNYGAFRDVQLWGLHCEGGSLCLRPGIGSDALQQPTHQPEELLDPSGRRLILLITDCVSSYWQEEVLIKTLKQWAQQSPIAIAQVLPEWLWVRTAIRGFESVQLVGLEPGVPNNKLVVDWSSAWQPVVDYQSGVCLPIVPLEPDSVLTWSRMVMGQGEAPGYWLQPFPSETELPSSSSRSPTQQLERFQLVSSPVAQRLMGLVAASPVITLPVIRLIQETLLPNSRQMHVAEVLLGGLLEPINPPQPETIPDEMEYRFVDEVLRDLLLAETPVPDTVQVLSGYVERQFDQSLDEFIAELQLWNQSEDSALVNKARSFATVTAAVLKRKGGRYREFVQQIEQQYQHHTGEEAAQSESIIESDQQGVVLVHDWVCELSISAHEENVTCVCFSPDGLSIVSSSDDSTIRLWNLQGNQVTQFIGHSGWVHSIVVSPNGNYIVSASIDATVRVWNIDGTLLHTLEGHTGSVLAVAISPNGHTIVSGSSDNTVRVWSIDGTLLHTLERHTGSVWSVAFSPDGNTIASGSDDNTVRVWELSSGQQIHTLLGHTDTIYSVDFSPDGQLLVSGSRDRTIRVWSLDGSLVGEPLQAHEKGVNSVAFSPDGWRLVSCSGDKSIKLWRSQEAVLAAVKRRKVLEVPYFSQMNNQFVPHASSSVTVLAMALAYHGIQPQQNRTLADEFYQWFEEHEESHHEHQALEKLYHTYGFDGGFSRHRTWQEITVEIDAERPVIVVGDFTRSGHFVCIIGHDNEGYIVHDPAGIYSSMGYTRGENEGNAVHYSYELMEQLCNIDSEIWSHFIIPRVVTAAQILSIFPDAAPLRVQEILPHLNRAMVEFRINTPLRQAYFITVTGYESGSFNFLEELASGIDYEGRSDLGNTSPGDGARFKGRGLLQLVGRANYQACSSALRVDLVAHPEKLADDDLACRSAGWFWLLHGFNEEADSDNAADLFNRVFGHRTAKQLEILKTAKAVLLPPIETSLEDDLRAALAIVNEQERTEALAHLMTQSPDVPSILLQILSTIEEQEERILALITLIPHLPPALLSTIPARDIALFQQQQGIPADGICGPQTLQAIAEVLRATRTQATDTPSRTSLWQTGNTQVYALCTSTPWNLPFDALVVPVGYQGGLGNLAAAFQAFLGMNSKWLSQAISEAMKAKKLRYIKLEHPLLVKLPPEANTQISSIVGSTTERSIICATSETEQELSSSNTSIAYEAVFRLAVERRFRRIVIPLIGTGVNQLPVDEVSRGMLRAINDVLTSLQPTNLEEITIVDRDEDKIAAITRISYALGVSNVEPQAGQDVEVFLSYSHRDEKLRDRLEPHLALLKREGVINTWHDRKINAGTEWVTPIDEHINSAGIILLLVSADFLASDYCYDIELQRALQRHEAGEALVIPIILKPVDWSGAPFGKLQAFPKDAKPVTKWMNRDEAFLSIAQGIRTAAVAVAERRRDQQPTIPTVANVSEVKPPASENVEVFFSYSHRDEALRDKLALHLSLLKRQGIIAAWHDRQITARTEWADEIDAHLNSASIILLLVSADFLASDYCYDIELQRALQRHEAGEALVIPIILKPVDWSGAPFGKLQAFPEDAKPVTTWTNQDEAFLNIAEGIRNAIRNITARD